MQKVLLFSIFCIFLYMPLKAIETKGFSLCGQVDYGYNYIDKSYGNFDAVGNYRLKGWDFNLGIGFTTAPDHSFYLRGLSTELFYHFRIPLRIRIHYLWNPYFAAEIHAQNIAWSLAFVSKHFDIELGSHFRFFQTSRDLPEKNAWTEKWNFIYMATAYIFPKTNSYNVLFGLENFDNFYVEAIGNPSFFVGGRYRYKQQKVSYFLTFYVKPAGFGNIHVNSFGYTVRGGFLWKI